MANATASDEPTTLEGLFPRDSRPDFNTSPLGSLIANRYVAWIDLMGARGMMARSLSRASGCIGRIHISVLDAVVPDVEAYPVIDGCYILAETRAALEKTLKRAMLSLASIFVHEDDPAKRFMVRGGIAAGRVITGANLARGGRTLKERPQYASCLAIGSAIGQAYSAEAQAPPFGFWVDITARSFRAETTHPFVTPYWRWWEGGTKGKRRGQMFGKLLSAHLAWSRQNRRELEYPLDRLDEHEDAAREYFRSLRDT